MNYIAAIIGVIVLLVTNGCANIQQMLGAEPVDYEDGSWSYCEYVKKDGTRYWITVPNSVAPRAGTEQTDGTVVKCDPIPKREAQ